MKSEQDEAVLKLVRVLKPDHPLRLQAMAALADPKTTPPDMSILRRVVSHIPAFAGKEFPVALWLITHTNWSKPQCVTLSETLSDALLRTLVIRKPVRMAVRWFMGVMLWLSVPVFTALFSERAAPQHDTMVILAGILLFALLPVGAIIVTPLGRWIDERKRKQLKPVIEALGCIGQPACLTALAMAALDYSLQDEAAAALVSITDRLQPDDYGTLPRDTVPALCRTFPVMPSQTVLRALAIIGDERAIPPVTHLVQATSHPEIRESATRLLVLLQQRALDSQASSQLLRAGSAPAETGETLLRIPQDQPDLNPSQLLRMASTESIDDPTR